MRPNSQFPADLVSFTKESLMENFIFCAMKSGLFRSSRPEMFCKINALKRFVGNLLKISSVNVTKFAENCEFGHICWRNS